MQRKIREKLFKLIDLIFYLSKTINKYFFYFTSSVGLLVIVDDIAVKIPH
jgi:hypothetical protein